MFFKGCGGRSGEPSINTEKDDEEIEFHLMCLNSVEKPKARRVDVMASHLIVEIPLFC